MLIGRRAVGRGTLQTVMARAGTGDLNLPSEEDAIADHADALVVQRIPFPLRINRAQNLQAFFREKRSRHG